MSFTAVTWSERYVRSAIESPAGRRPGALARNLVFKSFRETGRSGRRANPGVDLDRLVEALMMPIGREMRRRAVAAIRDADR